MHRRLGPIALILVAAACETNEAAAPVEVTADDLAGSYDLLSIGGTAMNELDEWYCISSELEMDDNGDFEIHHHFVERVDRGVSQPCSTDPDAFSFDLFWRGEFSNTSTLVVMTMEESEIALADTSEVTASNEELVGEYNPNTDRLVMSFPDIWSFNPHGGSGGKISIGSDGKGLGGGALVFAR